MSARPPCALALAAIVLGALSAPAAAGARPSPRSAAPPKPASRAPAKAPVRPPPPPLSILPSVARVRVTSYGKMLVVVEEVNLPRGGWAGEPLDFHVAFGAPGPRAIDAHLVAVRDGELEPGDDEAGEALTVERVARRPPGAHPLLGRDTMAGVVVHVPSVALREALEPGEMASLRIRSLVDATEPDGSGALSVLVRLGASRGTPLTLGRVVVTSAAPSAPLTRVEARLCGPEADPHPLATSPRTALEGERPVAPVLAVRHATDDLCLRLWHASP